MTHAWVRPVESRTARQRRGRWPVGGHPRAGGTAQPRNYPLGRHRQSAMGGQVAPL